MHTHTHTTEMDSFINQIKDDDLLNRYLEFLIERACENQSIINDDSLLSEMDGDYVEWMVMATHNEVVEKFKMAYEKFKEQPLNTTPHSKSPLSAMVKEHESTIPSYHEHEKKLTFYDYVRGESAAQITSL